MWMPLPWTTEGNTKMFVAIYEINWNIIKNKLW